MTRRADWLYAAGMAAAVLLPIAAARIHPLPPGRCERDGVAVGDHPAALALDGSGATHPFCSIRCAEAWIARHGERDARVLVRDEVTGAPLASGAAWFVKSRVDGTSGEQIRAFARREDAEAHVAAFRGTLLGRGERPFRDAGSP